MKSPKGDGQPIQGTAARYNVRLPGFLTEEPIGLGDFIKKATHSVGIKPCGGCEQRAAAMNRWMTLGRQR